MDNKFYAELIAYRAGEANKRMFYVIVLQLMIILALAGWCIFQETQYETQTTTIETSQEVSGNGNNYFIGGNYGSEAEGQSN